MAAWECRRPTWRHDVLREIDLVEEVARHYGFDKFPARLPPARQPAGRLPHAGAEDAIRERLVGLGYQEIVSIPLVDPTDDALFRAEGATGAVVIGNPLASDASQMRSSGIVNMLHALEWNINRGQHNARLFEIGKAYVMDGIAPRETPILTIGATGTAREKSVHDSARPFSFADLKGDLEALGQLAGGFAWTAGAPHWLAGAHAGSISMAGRGFSPTEKSASPKGALAPGVIGAAGRLAKLVQERFKLRQEAFVAELAMEPLYAGFAAARGTVRYSPIAKFPAVERDFSLVLADGTAFADVAGTIRALGIAEVVSIEAVDLFRGGQMPKGKHSLLVRVVFQSTEGTFTEARLSDFSARIVAALEKNVGATLRAV